MSALKLDPFQSHIFFEENVYNYNHENNILNKNRILKIWESP